MAHWRLPLLLALLCVALQGLGWDEALRYERALLGSEPWRLLGAHLVHLGWTHLLLNLAALALIWALCGHALPVPAWGPVLALCALAVSLGLYLRDVEVGWYVGLSGVLHGLLVCGALAGWRREPRTSLVLLIGTGAKLAWEQLAGTAIGTQALVGGAVIVNAHLYGALGGGLGALLLDLGRRWRQRP